MDLPVNHDGAKILSGGPLSKLPIEWLIQVLQWLPTQYLFTIMSVSREWECAVRYIIRTRPSLVVHVKGSENPFTFFSIMFPGYKPGRPIFVTWYEVTASLHKMENLIRFEDRTGLPRMEDMIGGDYTSIMTRNSVTLREIVCHTLPDDGSVSYPNLKTLDCFYFDASQAGRLCPQLEQLIVRDELRESSEGPLLPNLKSLRSPADYPCMDGFWKYLVRYAKQLEVMEVEKFIHGQMVTFNRVTDLTMNVLPNCAKFPSLKQLKVGHEYRPGLLLNLPLEQLVKFDVTIRRHRHYKDTTGANQSVCESISRMKRLTHFSLRISKDWPADNLDKPDLFAGVNHLIEAVIDVKDGAEERASVTKHWATSLIKNNPHLQKLHLIGIPVHDDDLLLCSQLENLSHLKLGSLFGDVSYTTAGIQSLMRSKFRNSVVEFTVVARRRVIRDIDLEFDLLEKERNVVFKRKRNSLGMRFEAQYRICND